MRSPVIQLICFFMAAVMLSGSGGRAPLAHLQWKSRVLLLFSPSAAHHSFRSLRQEIEHNTKGIRERDLLIVSLLLGDAVRLQGKIAGANREKLEGNLLRERFGVGDGEFRVTLIGKDGRQKLSTSQPVSLGNIFQTVDAMPMRQVEMKRKKKN